MGILTYTDEYTSPIPPARLFKALVLDAHILIPKIMPQAIKSFEVVQGDGKAGSIKLMTFPEGSHLKSIKTRIDELDEEKFIYNYTLIEGSELLEKLEYISYEVKFEPTPEGGSKNKMVSKYCTKGDFELKEEEIKASKEKALAMYKVAEGYLIQNPDDYA
ncbi:hypothetical protein UlMin_009600 [Ulmus minor]